MRPRRQYAAMRRAAGLQGIDSAGRAVPRGFENAPPEHESCAVPVEFLVFWADNAALQYGSRVKARNATPALRRAGSQATAKSAKSEVSPQIQFSSIFNAAMKASCGISTCPNWRIFFLP